jgi:DNA-directed RNA polymerase subunit F
LAVFLTSPTKYTTRYLKSLDKISSEIAELLLEHLIKIGKLDRTVLKRLTAHW